MAGTDRLLSFFHGVAYDAKLLFLRQLTMWDVANLLHLNQTWHADGLLRDLLDDERACRWAIHECQCLKQPGFPTPPCNPTDWGVEPSQLELASNLRWCDTYPGLWECPATVYSTHGKWDVLPSGEARRVCNICRDYLEAVERERERVEWEECFRLDMEYLERQEGSLKAKWKRGLARLKSKAKSAWKKAACS